MPGIVEKRRLAALAVMVAGLAVACGDGGASGDSTTVATGEAQALPGAGGFTGVQVPGSPPAPPLRLTDSSGAVFDLAAQRGKVVLVFFGYTNCPDVCPTTLATWSRAKKQLGADTAGIRWVFVTTDPERDTPAVAQRYASQFDRAFVGLSGSQAQLDSVQKGFRVSSFREPNPAHSGSDPHAEHGGGYSIAHASRVFAIDRQGRWRLVMPAGASVEQLLGDVRKLLQEG